MYGYEKTVYDSNTALENNCISVGDCTAVYRFLLGHEISSIAGHTTAHNDYKGYKQVSKRRGF